MADPRGDERAPVGFGSRAAPSSEIGAGLWGSGSGKPDGGPAGRAGPERQAPAELCRPIHETAPGRPRPPLSTSKGSGGALGLKRFEGVSSTAKRCRCSRPLLGLRHLHPLSLPPGAREMLPWERLMRRRKSRSDRRLAPHAPILLGTGDRGALGRFVVTPRKARQGSEEGALLFPLLRKR